MAKEVNRAKAARDYARAHPDATNREISAALRKRAILLAASRVWFIRAKSDARPRTVKTAVMKVAVGRGVGLPETKVAMSFLALTGGVEGADHALTAAKKVIASRDGGSPEVKLTLFLLELTGGIEGANVALTAAQEIRAIV
jgi:hypothetical protein